MDRRRRKLGRQSRADVATARVPRDRRQPGVRGGRTGPAAGDPHAAGARTGAAPAAAARSASDSACGRAAAPTATSACQAPDVRDRSRSLPRARRGAATDRTRPPVRERSAVPNLAGDRRRRGLADDAKRRRRRQLSSIGLPAAAPPAVTRARSPRASREPSASCGCAAAASMRRSLPRGCSRKSGARIAATLDFGDRFFADRAPRRSGDVVDLEGGPQQSGRPGRRPALVPSSASM